MIVSFSEFVFLFPAEYMASPIHIGWRLYYYYHLFL